MSWLPVPARPPQVLLHTAALFRLLAHGFVYPEPGHNRSFLRVLAKTAASSADTPSLASLKLAWLTAGEALLQAEYGRLFLGRVPCPLHETAYGDGRRIAGRAVELADISGFYAAFGLKLSQADPDLPDHLVSELEFYSLLLVKQAYAGSRRRPAQRAITRKAAHRFLEEHLGRWVGAFVAGLAAQTPAAPYRELARALRALIARECAAVRARPRLREGRPPLDETQADAFVCPHQAATTAGAAA